MNTSKPYILLIYTGGTIGMVKDPDTGFLKAFNFKNLIKKTRNDSGKHVLRTPYF